MNLITRNVDASPHVSSLLEGHRDFGYCLETALADIIDNSITARAAIVEINADTSSKHPYIAIADDGLGMTEDELIEAMRLGSRNPLDTRSPNDLGRFGLGLKSASFSQCRSLTVLTKQGGQVSCARWDLDRVAAQNDWSLELIDNPEGLIGFDLLRERGTVIVWEKLDRTSGGYDGEHAKRVEHMNAELARAEYHLRLVFHRFLDNRKREFSLSLNGRLLKPVDPTASSHPATQWEPEEVLRLNNGDVKIRCFTLPHHDRMTKEQWEEIGGPEGHLKSQGLYVYREGRLIIAGGWLGLARQKELSKLCRIVIDIPNTMDAQWKIDVKKASAQLPPLVRERLNKIIEKYVGTSRRTYHRRGQKLVEESRYPIWNRVRKDGQVVFRPNIDHPVFRSYSSQLPEAMRSGFERCLRIAGAGLPIDTLYSELVGNVEAVAADQTSADDLKELVSTLASALIENGVPKETLSETMRAYPILKSQWNVAAPILEGLIRLKYS